MQHLLFQFVKNIKKFLQALTNPTLGTFMTFLPILEEWIFYLEYLLTVSHFFDFLKLFHWPIFQKKIMFRLREKLASSVRMNERTSKYEFTGPKHLKEYNTINLKYERNTCRRNLACLSLREKCQNIEFFSGPYFLYSDWIQENTDQKKLRIWTLFAQCL